jgi:hypothetical protein
MHGVTLCHILLENGARERHVVCVLLFFLVRICEFYYVVLSMCTIRNLIENLQNDKKAMLISHE